jgi:hypothetical protein
LNQQLLHQFLQNLVCGRGGIVGISDAFDVDDPGLRQAPLKRLGGNSEFTHTQQQIVRRISGWFGTAARAPGDSKSKTQP